MKRQLIILLTVIVLSAMLLVTSIVNGQEVKKLVAVEEAMEKGLVCEKRINKLNERGRKLLEDLGLTVKVRQLVDNKVDSTYSAYEEMDVTKFVLLKVLETDELQRDLWNYNKERGTHMDLEAVLGCISLFCKELEQEKKEAIKENAKQ